MCIDLQALWYDFMGSAVVEKDQMIGSYGVEASPCLVRMSFLSRGAECGLLCCCLFSSSPVCFALGWCRSAGLGFWWEKWPAAPVLVLLVAQLL